MAPSHRRRRSVRPGSRTIMSGVRREPSASTDSFRSKSQYSSMPAASTTRRSCSSPHWPRTFGERSACTSRPVSVCSDCCAWCSERSCSVSADALPTRFFSTSCSLTSTLPSESLSGCTRSSIALWRPSRSILAVCWNSVSEAFARSRNDWLFWRRASDDSAENASRSFSSASLRSVSLSADARRSAASSASRRARVAASSAASCERTTATSRSAWARMTNHTLTASSRPKAIRLTTTRVTRRSLGEGEAKVPAGSYDRDCDRDR